MSEKIFPIAREFNILNRDIYAHKKKWFSVIDKITDFCNDPKLPMINPDKVFPSIRRNENATF